MKLKLLFLAMFLTSAMAYGQEYKAVKVGIGLGYAMPQGSGSKAGVLFYLEPAYRLNDNIAVGLRLEAAVMARVAVVANQTSSSATADVSANGSYTLNGQYYFGTKKFRPFAGAGLGIYSLASATVSGSSNSSGSSSSSTSEVSAGNEFGFYPRVGFDVGHFSMNLEYNIIPKTTALVQVTDSNGSTTTKESTTKNSYLGIKVGFFFGGGKKK